MGSQQMAFMANQHMVGMGSHRMASKAIMGRHTLKMAIDPLKRIYKNVHINLLFCKIIEAEEEEFHMKISE